MSSRKIIITSHHNGLSCLGSLGGQLVSADSESTRAIILIMMMMIIIIIIMTMIIVDKNKTRSNIACVKLSSCHIVNDENIAKIASALPITVYSRVPMS